jgi:SPP1 family predicted phage head-tail adaptor
MSRYPQRPQLVGNLRELVTLQYATTVPDGFGNHIETWHDVGPIYARVEPLGGEERIQASGLTAPYNVRVHIRYRQGITPEWRLVYKGETFQIRAVSNYDERRQFLTLDCEGDVAA